MKIAILDDYQGVSPQMADWSQLPPGLEVQMFLDHLSDEDALVGLPGSHGDEGAYRFPPLLTGAPS